MFVTGVMAEAAVRSKTAEQRSSFLAYGILRLHGSGQKAGGSNPLAPAIS